MGQGTWWQRIWKRLRYFVPSLTFSLLVRPALRNPRTLRTLRKVQGKKGLLEEDQVRKPLNRPGRHDFMGCFPQVLWELADIIARTLSVIF